ncbi:hypothetical protein BsWGS_12835 [Bradybaena similaris]
MKSQKGKQGRKRNGSPNQSEPVAVYCRLRPLDDPNETGCVNAIGDTVVQLLPPENAAVKNGQLKEYQFTFQHVFDEFASQKALFDYIALPLVEDLVAGKNGLLFTYGITGSGKTYTMTGRPEDQGILPRCVDVIFNSIGELQAKKYVFRPDRLNGFEIHSDADAMIERQRKDILPSLTPSKTFLKKMDSCDADRIIDPTKVDTVEEDNNYAVFVSYIEIYNNYVYDLLEELPYNAITGYKPPQTKILRTDSSDNMYVHNCTEVEVKQSQEAIDIFYKGQKRRKVAHTTLNAESSRSHSVFNIRLVQAPLDDRGEEVVQDNSRLCVSQLSLVDLAGSERTNRTKNSGDRLKEAGNINQSLLVLRTCLEILRENQKAGANKLVPYRDSRLTHLFKNFFDGDGKVRMIVCINPKVADYEETIHVMKFAELTQEVLIAKSEEVKSKFDIGMTPGRRRMHQEQLDKLEQLSNPSLPSVEFTVGPPFPLLELLSPTDDTTIRNIILCLTERMKRKRETAMVYDPSCISFRSNLMELEQNYIQATNRLQEMQEYAAMKEKEKARMDNKLKSLEKRLEESERQKKDLDKENQLLRLQVQDKSWKIQVERNSKEKLKSEYQNRLQMNNDAWEKNLEKERRQIEIEAENKLHERDRKLDMLREIVNENDCPTPVLRSKGSSQPTAKPRTHTTPAALPSARSESDMTSVGSSTIASSARAAAGRAGNTRVQSRNTVRIPPAKSITNLDLAGVTPSISKSRQPIINHRSHRRSKSSGSAETWLEHKPNDCIQTDTLFQPKMARKKSVSKLDVKDTKSATKYVLTHQEQDSSDELVTKLIKGDVIPTASGGSAVIFNDVEMLKQDSPGSRKRRSPTTPRYDPELHWADTEERCSVALEGHSRKRGKITNL